MEAATVDLGTGNPGLRFRIMRMQNSGEEKQTGERVQKQNQQVIECGAKQEEGKMTVKILA